MRITKEAKQFVQGYVCAVSGMVSGHGESTMAEEALRDCGLVSVKIMRRYGIEDHDIEVLKPVIKHIQARRRRSGIK